MLFDDVLHPLMTRERCEVILSTSRGWEAKKRFPPFPSQSLELSTSKYVNPKSRLLSPTP